MIRRAVPAVAAAALAAALAAGLIIGASPVGAHPDGWTSSWAVGQGSRFAESPVAGFTFTHDGPPTQPGIEKVTFSLAVVAEGEVPPGCAPPAPGPLMVDPRRDDAETLTAAVSLPVPCNGRYSVTAVASTAASPLHPVDSSPPLTLAFETAIPPLPPTDVTAEPADLDGDRAARVTWEPPAAVPPDFVGYLIARSRSADDGFEVVGESVEPEFVDGEAAEGGEFHYRVQSVRLGPAAGELISSAPSDAAAVDVPTPATPTSTGSTPTSVNRPGGDLSGFGSLQQQAARLRPAPAPAPAATVRPGPVTTVDNGFQETLPFDPNASAPPTTAAPGELDGPLAAGGSSQIFEADDPSDRKAVLGPVAGAAALLVGFLQLRWLIRQASTT